MSTIAVHSGSNWVGVNVSNIPTRKEALALIYIFECYYKMTEIPDSDKNTAE